MAGCRADTGCAASGHSRPGSFSSDRVQTGEEQRVLFCMAACRCRCANLRQVVTPTSRPRLEAFVDIQTFDDAAHGILLHCGLACGAMPWGRSSSAIANGEMMASYRQVLGRRTSALRDTPPDFGVWTAWGSRRTEGMGRECRGEHARGTARHAADRRRRLTERSGARAARGPRVAALGLASRWAHMADRLWRTRRRDHGLETRWARGAEGLVVTWTRCSPNGGGSDDVDAGGATS